MKKNISANALEKIKKELIHLKTVKRREMAERLKEAISFGDLKENAAYHEAKDAQAFLEGRIIELESIVRDSFVSPIVRSGKVGLGSLIEVKSAQGEVEFEIVNPVESDPLEGKISESSPIGKALLGAGEGDVREVKMPSGELMKYKILKIR